jgi:hypothetical protein
MNTFRSKIPELALEAAMVVFAVVVALAVEEWREDRDNKELARRALAGIMAEVESNKDEILRSQEANDSVLALVREAARDTVLPEELSINYEYSLLSSSAWETAQITRATQFLPLGQVQSLARVYGLQSLFKESQDEVMDFILRVGEVAESDPDRIPRLLVGPLNNAVGMADLLVTVYDTTLVNLGGSGGG